MKNFLETMRVVFQLASFSQISEAPFVAISPFRGDPLEEQIAEVDGSKRKL